MPAKLCEKAVAQGNTIQRRNTQLVIVETKQFSPTGFKLSIPKQMCYYCVVGIVNYSEELPLMPELCAFVLCSYISVTSSMHEQWFLGENTSYTFVLPLISAVNFLLISGLAMESKEKHFFFVPLIVAVPAVRNFCFRRYTVN